MSSASPAWFSSVRRPVGCERHGPPAANNPRGHALYRRLGYRQLQTEPPLAKRGYGDYNSLIILHPNAFVRPSSLCGQTGVHP